MTRFEYKLILKNKTKKTKKNNCLVNHNEMLLNYATNIEADTIEALYQRKQQRRKEEK